MSENRIAAALGDSKLIQAHQADVARIRDRTRRLRLIRAIVVFGGLSMYLAYRYAAGRPLRFPKVGPDAAVWLPGILLILLLGAVLVLPMLGSGRSPHVLIRPEHIDVGLDEIRGLDGQVDEVVRSLNVFLGYRTFRQILGGTPRRGILFEGPPGTGKTYMAKAMAKQASVPFLFVSAPAFQSMWFGMTNVKIRAFFKALRKAARRYGGAIGFMEEIDAIGMDRGALAMSDRPGEDGVAGPRSVSRYAASGASGMVNELLIQMQSFDQSTTRQRLLERFVGWINGYLPEGRALRAGKPVYHNILLIAATNRADSLDAALLRPGRFDRRLYFDLPTKKGRRDLIDFFLARKAHHEQLDGEEARERIAHDTLGYTPVMIEHLFDEALLMALRDGREAMNVADVYSAKLTEEIGLAQPTAYTDDDRRAVATHEAGHAAAAYVLGTGRRLEVLSIIKRRSSLGLLAHSELEERFTQTREELEATVAIALGGMAAEEVFLGQSGSGPGSDLAGATQTAALMVGALGMAGSLISYEAVAEGAIGRRNLVGKVLADGEAKAKVEALLQAQHERVTRVLGENRDLVEALRDALIERDELIGDQITDVLEAAIARRPVPSTSPPSGADRLIDLTGEAEHPRVPGRHS
jgi:cell division protease FtsH